MNCKGLIDTTTDPNLRKFKDGICYFGYYPEAMNKELINIDYNLPLAKTTIEKSDQANMYNRI
jgi:hypothetical protein